MVIPRPAYTPTPPPIGTCATCKFWESFDVANRGRCHFYAPAVPPHEKEQQALWPQTDPTDWCGQFVART